MIFTEETNFFNNPPSLPGDSVWKPAPGPETNGPPNASKLNTWAGKPRQKENSLGSGSFNGTDDEKGWPGGGGGTNTARHTPHADAKLAWSDAEPLDHAEFSGKPGGAAPPALGQWGRAEVNQSTPWEVERSGFAPPEPPRFMPAAVSMDNGTGQWRSWDHDAGFQKDFHPFPMGGLPNANKMPNNFYGGGHNFVMQQGFGDRMMRNGPPHLNQQQPQQPWGNKFGGGGQRNAGAGNFQQFGGPGPQGGPMSMMPPGMMDRVMGPPPPLAQQHHQRGGPHHPGGPPPPPPMGHHMPHMAGAPQSQANFSVGTFSSHASILNDDSFWHDPNGDLRKWQRDTGTAHWGDPTKQQGQPIRRWTQLDSNTNGNNDDLKHDDDETGVHETGWGELPPLNGSSAPATAAATNPTSSISSAAWMNNAPGAPALAPQAAPAQPGGWADSQRSIPPNSFVPPNPQFAPNNFYGGSGMPLVPGADWGSRPPLVPYGQQHQQQQQQQQQQQHFDAAHANKDIADKLRIAAAKGLIDMNLIMSLGATPLPPNTLKLINSMLDVLTDLEQLEEQLKRAGVGAADASDRRVPELAQKRAALEDLRDKVNSSLGHGAAAAHRPPPARQGGLSLADELTNMNTLPPIGGDVTQLW